MTTRFLDYINNTPFVYVDEVSEGFAFISICMAQSKLLVEGGDPRDAMGTMHEFHFIHAMNKHLGHPDGFMPDDKRRDEANAKLKKLTAKLRPEVNDEVKRKAYASAAVIHKFMKDNDHEHHGTYISSKEGDIEKITGIKAGQKDNASDAISHIKDVHGNSRFMGISLKHNHAGTGHKPTANPGVGTTDKALSTSTSHHMTNARKLIDKEFPQYSHLTKAEKKLKARPAKDGVPASRYYTRSYHHTREAISKIADQHVKAFNGMPHATRLAHFRTHIHAHYTADVPQIVVTSHKEGTRVENRAVDYDSSKIKSISAKRHSWNIMRHEVSFNDGHTEIWDHRYKAADGPGSSIKGSMERQKDKTTT